jgi:hypothetical protein
MLALLLASTCQSPKRWPPLARVLAERPLAVGNDPLVHFPVPVQWSGREVISLFLISLTRRVDSS